MMHEHHILTNPISGLAEDNAGNNNLQRLVDAVITGELVVIHDVLAEWRQG